MARATQIKLEPAFEKEEGEISALNDETGSPVLLSATKLLEYKASKYDDVQLSWHIKEMDTGVLGHSTYFECNVTAGNFSGNGKSICKKMAKNYAAHNLLLKLKNYDENMEDWKQPVFIKESLDPVFLLDQYTKVQKNSLPVYKYIYQELENGETVHSYQCFLGSKVKQGEAPNKELAKRLAAFEMLNDIMEKKKTTGGTDNDHSTMHLYASLDEVAVNAIRNDSSYVENLVSKPFEVFARKSSVPEEPSHLITRHFYNAKNPNAEDFTRYMVEIQATFDDDKDDKEGMCYANAMNFKKVIENYLTGC